MDAFIVWLFGNFQHLFNELTLETVNFIGGQIEGFFGAALDDYTINLVLFSETPIISTTLGELLSIFFSIFYTVIFIVIVWKIIKKVVVKITRWDKW